MTQPQPDPDPRADILDTDQTGQPVGGGQRAADPNQSPSPAADDTAPEVSTGVADEQQASAADHTAQQPDPSAAETAQQPKPVQSQDDRFTLQPDESELAPPTTSVLDEGFDPTAATRVMGMTPEPAADLTVAGTDQHVSEDPNAEQDRDAGTDDPPTDSQHGSTAGPTAVDDASAGSQPATGADQSDEELAPAAAQAMSHVPPGPYGPGSAEPLEGGVPPEGFSVKGDTRSMSYTTPDSPDFGQTSADVWFATVEDAAAAGFSSDEHQPG